MNNEIKWFGTAGHFCASTNCRFHLSTQVGKFLISTVGAYFPLFQDKMEPMSFSTVFEVRRDFYYETMVFVAGSPCNTPDCNCGVPDHNGKAIECFRYRTAQEATQGHLKLIEKYQEK